MSFGAQPRSNATFTAGKFEFFDAARLVQAELVGSKLTFETAANFSSRLDSVHESRTILNSKETE